MYRYVSLIPILVLAAILTSCTKAQDLDAPCPDFGRYCPQTPINDLF
jgi:hypothetical protein